jgi:hypothetical protein
MGVSPKLRAGAFGALAAVHFDSTLSASRRDSKTTRFLRVVRLWTVRRNRRPFKMASCARSRSLTLRRHPTPPPAAPRGVGLPRCGAAICGTGKPDGETSSSLPLHPSASIAGQAINRHARPQSQASENHRPLSVSTGPSMAVTLIRGLLARTSPPSASQCIPQREGIAPIFVVEMVRRSRFPEC